MRTIKSVIDGIEYSAVVRTATLGDGIELARLMRDGEKSDSEYSGFLASTYPVLVSCCEELCGEKGRPTPEKILALPETFVDEWFALVRDVNCHWFRVKEKNSDDLKGQHLTSTPG